MLFHHGFFDERLLVQQIVIHNDVELARKQLFLDRKLDGKKLADLIYNFIDHFKFRPCGQIIGFIRNLAKIMAGQKAVQHQDDKAAEIGLGFGLEMPLRIYVIDQIVNLLIKGEGAVDLVKIILQNVTADVEFIAVERDALAGLAGNL